MAKRPILKDEKPTGSRLRRLTNILEAVSNNPLPETYKAGRASQLQTAKWAGTIFESIEAREKGAYIISGLPLKITDTDFEAFSMGVAQILYNQSHQSGNLDTNSGLEKKEAKALTEASKDGHTYYEGTIIATLNELCRKSYGVDLPTTQQKEAMISLIDTLHETPVSIDYPNGDRAELYLAVKMGKFTRAADGAVTYWLSLNPIFCEGVRNNFSEHPQDLTKRLTAATNKKTAAHYRLLKLLGAQKRTNKPFVRTIPVLIEELGMTKEYKKNRSRAEQRLLSIFDDMVKIGIITNFETEEAYNRSKRTLSKVRFYLNPNYPRKLKQQAQDTQQTEP